MKLQKGDRFRDYMGKHCFISYIKGDVVKLTFISKESYVEVWEINDLKHEINMNRFFPQPKLIVNRLNITEHLIEYQLNMIGKTLDDAKVDDMWWSTFTMTQKQFEVFKSYAIPLLRKVFKFNKKKAEDTFEWFNLQYGLRIKN